MKLPALPDRVETGVMQFGDDWPGIFIRGDDALSFAHAIAHGSLGRLGELVELLRSCKRDAD
jgi:hypothetical protein